MKNWPKIAIIAFILLFVLSIATSKTEVVQLDHGSGVGVQILHEKKLFFIHSFQIEVYNGTEQTIAVKQPISAFTLVPGGSYPTSKNDVLVMEELPANERVAGQKETIYRFTNTFHLAAVVQFEVNGQQHAIEISERLGDSK